MPLRCLVVRVRPFLSTHDVNVLHMAQSEHGEYISITLLYEEPAAVG